MSWQELKAALLGGFPPGAEDAWNFEAAPGQNLEAIAKLVDEKLVAPLDVLATETSPLTAAANLPRWERALGITALAATLAQRRAVVLSRLRELGRIVTRPMVQGVLAPLLDMADASEVVVIESDRDALRALHSYPWSGSESFTTTPATVYFRVLDDAAVSSAGAQVDITVTYSDASLLTATLTAPDGTTATVSYFARGAAAHTTYRLYFKSLAGAAVGGPRGGTWSLAVATTGAGSGTITAASLFVEGFGRDGTLHDGLGAAVWFWGVMVEDDKIGPGADLVAARRALARIRYACRPASLLRRSNGPGKLAAGHYAAIPGDVNALPNAALPGTG